MSEPYGDMLCLTFAGFFLFIFLPHLIAWPLWASVVFALVGFLSLHKTPEPLCRLGNVTKASSAIVVSRKRVEISNFGG